jgi:hypothetical protein
MLRACIWLVYRGLNGRTGRFGCLVGTRFGHLRDFSDSFFTEFYEVRIAPVQPLWVPQRPLLCLFGDALSPALSYYY